MRLKLEMGGGKAESQKVTTENGELIEGVKSAGWKMEGGVERPIVVIELYAEKVDFDIGIGQEEPSEDS